MAATRYQGDNCEDMERLLTHVWAPDSDENLGESSDSEFSESGTEESDGESERSFQSFEQSQDFSSESGNSSDEREMPQSSTSTSAAPSNGSKRKRTAKSQPPSKRNSATNGTTTSTTRGTAQRVSARGRSAGGGTRRNRENLSSRFQWKEDFGPRNLSDFRFTPGPIGEKPGMGKPIDYFELFFSPEIFDLFVQMTNLNAKRKIEAGAKGQWKDVTLSEMKAFFGLCVAMGILRLPRIEEYWRKVDWLFLTPSFSEVMSRDRFVLIFRYLHVCDEDKAIPRGQPGHDKLFKVRSLLDLLLRNLTSHYQLHRELSIDESMIPFKGRLSFRQFLPSKPIRFGIKCFVLAEAKSGYVANFQVYVGKEGNATEVNLSSRVVKDLMEKFQNKGHHLFTDNYYTSPELFDDLANVDVLACGTVKGQRKGFPRELVLTNVKDKERGYTAWRMARQLLATVWLDSKPVYFLSTIHSPSFPPGTPVENRTVQRRGGAKNREALQVPCPPVVKEYNKYMGGVDIFDQHAQYYNFGRKSKRWYRRVIWYLVEIAINNSYIIEGHFEDHSHRGHRARSLLQFRKELAEQLLGKHRTSRNVGRPRLSEEHRLQDVGIHQPVFTPKPLVCKVCSKNVRREHKQTSLGLPANRRANVPYISRSRVFCESCNVSLCLCSERNCWKDWHTKVEFWR